MSANKHFNDQDSGFVTSEYHVFHELIKPVVRQDFEQLAKVHHVGQKFRAASRVGSVYCHIAMSQFSVGQSLRDIQSNLECQPEKAKSSLSKVYSPEEHAGTNQ